MPQQPTWLIDFDDTLASGNMTWALREAFPKLIQTHRLAYDPARLNHILLDLQARANESEPLDVLLRELFEGMGWPRALERGFLDDLMTGYQPELFDDSLPFLRRLKDSGQRVIILSNNPRALDNATALGITPYVDAVYTPYSLPDMQPKPHRSLWDYVVAEHLDVAPELARVVGDDPWSDGAFAAACGLPCWIVDRAGRLREPVEANGWYWVRSLDEISA